MDQNLHQLFLNKISKNFKEITQNKEFIIEYFSEKFEDLFKNLTRMTTIETSEQFKIKINNDNYVEINFSLKTDFHPYDRPNFTVTKIDNITLNHIEIKMKYPKELMKFVEYCIYIRDD
jgi:hypothetical protein